MTDAFKVQGLPISTVIAETNTWRAVADAWWNNGGYQPYLDAAHQCFNDLMDAGQTAASLQPPAGKTADEPIDLAKWSVDVAAGYAAANYWTSVVSALSADLAAWNNRNGSS
jgi:hypothetical protein